MLRKSLHLLIPFAAAKALFLDAGGKPRATPNALLPEVLTALREHYKDGGEIFARVAMEHIVQLDTSDDDTVMIAELHAETGNACRPVATTMAQGLPVDFTGATGRVEDGLSSSVDTETPGQCPSPHFLVELMKAYPHSVEVRERCCRCLANICQLEVCSADMPHRNSSTKRNSLAETLVQGGAMELVLGTLRMMHRLSDKGRCWVALAALNLLCMSRHGAARAAAAGGEEFLTEFLLFLLENQRGGEPDPQQWIALDAALGALTGVLAAEAPENTQGISYNYEKVSYTAVDAVVRCALVASAQLVRAGRYDGAYGASLPSKRYLPCAFDRASPRQVQAITQLLPVLQKAWMALQLVTSHAPNLTFTFDALYEAAKMNQESVAPVPSREDDSAIATTMVRGRPSVAGLSVLIEAAMFVLVELEGDGAMTAELAQLQDAMRLSVLECLASMTDARKDLRTSQITPVGGVAAKETSVSATVPTPAAIAVMDVMASGTVSSMALVTAVRLHTNHRSAGHSLPNGSAAALEPYAAHDFALLSKALTVLTHLGEAQDEVVLSANTVAAVQAMLRDSYDSLDGLVTKYPSTALVELFKPSCDCVDTAQAASAALKSGDHLGFVQLAALVGQTYSVMWGCLRTATGVEVVMELDVSRTADALQLVLKRLHTLVEEAHQRYQLQTTDSKWVASASEESITRLLKLGEAFTGSLRDLMRERKG